MVRENAAIIAVLSIVIARALVADAVVRHEAAGGMNAIIQGGGEGIFWQTPRTTRQARPGIPVPRRLAAGLAKLLGDALISLST